MINFIIKHPSTVAFTFSAAFFAFGAFDLYLWLSTDSGGISPFSSILFLVSSPFFLLMGMEIARLTKTIRSNENATSSNG